MQKFKMGDKVLVKLDTPFGGPHIIIPGVIFKDQGFDCYSVITLNNYTITLFHASEIKPMEEKEAAPSKKCCCDIRDLMMCGCRCGGN